MKAYSSKNNSTKGKAIIVDIDGTISDRNHRLHYLEGKKNWKKFFEEIHLDPPIKEIIALVEKDNLDGYKVIFVSGRPENLRKKTLTWIKSNIEVEDFILLMRPNKDFRKDVIIKAEIFQHILLEYNPVKAYEDSPEIQNLWLKNNLEVIDCS
tara:strand:- start:6424 stop:6882 length:459 start_codon:yes stop_codon:yes gene_type:complete